MEQSIKLGWSRDHVEEHERGGHGSSGLEGEVV